MTPGKASTTSPAPPPTRHGSLRTSPRIWGAAGLKHPVHDFLFTYYDVRPAQLMRWTAGLDASDPVVIERRPRIEQIHELLVATAGRPGNFGCFGLHEWAMPLRPGAAETDAVTGSPSTMPKARFSATEDDAPDSEPSSVAR